MKITGINRWYFSLQIWDVTALIHHQAIAEVGQTTTGFRIRLEVKKSWLNLGLIMLNHHFFRSKSMKNMTIAPGVYHLWPRVQSGARFWRWTLIEKTGWKHADHEPKKWISPELSAIQPIKMDCHILNYTEPTNIGILAMGTLASKNQNLDLSKKDGDNMEIQPTKHRILPTRIGICQPTSGMDEWDLPSGNLRHSNSMVNKNTAGNRTIIIWSPCPNSHNLVSIADNIATCSYGWKLKGTGCLQNGKTLCRPQWAYLQTTHMQWCQ